jgi:hypothetical protein
MAANEQYSPEQLAAFANAISVSEMQSLKREFDLASGRFRTDNDPLILIPVETPQPTREARTVSVNGQKYTVEAPVGDTAALDRAETELFRKILAQPAAQIRQQEQTRDTQGRFISQAELDAEAARVAAIDPADAATAELVRRTLAQQGVDMDALRELSAQRQGQALEQSWTDAAISFGKSHADWVGGEYNKNTLAQIISDNGWVEAEDKGRALEDAYVFAIEHHMLVEPEDQVEARELAAAQTPAELQELLRAKGHLAPINSGMWGR